MLSEEHHRHKQKGCLGNSEADMRMKVCCQSEMVESLKEIL